MRFLVPTDFSEAADQALEVAIRYARLLAADLVLLHVITEGPLYAEDLGDVQLDRIHAAQERWADEHMRPRLAGLEAAGLGARAIIVVGAPAREIVRAAEAEHADLIVMGTHGRGGAGRFFLGSVTDRVIRAAGCPVMTVRGVTSAG